MRTHCIDRWRCWRNRRADARQAPLSFPTLSSIQQLIIAKMPVTCTLNEQSVVSAEKDSRLPVTLLSGFLGSGTFPFAIELHHLFLLT
jgi:hypothetical protein